MDCGLGIKHGLGIKIMGTRNYRLSIRHGLGIKHRQLTVVYIMYSFREVTERNG